MRCDRWLQLGAPGGGRSAGRWCVCITAGTQREPWYSGSGKDRKTDGGKHALVTRRAGRQLSGVRRGTCIVEICIDYGMRHWHRMDQLVLPAGGRVAFSTRASSNLFGRQRREVMSFGHTRSCIKRSPARGPRAGSEEPTGMNGTQRWWPTATPGMTVWCDNIVGRLLCRDG